MDAIIAIGSNIGDRYGYVNKAVDLVGERAGKVRAISDILETRAYGHTEQDDFLNLVIEIDTDLEPFALLEILHGIEADLDRVRTIRWGPRTIDLDIIFYGDMIVDMEHLHIPHVDMYNRDFVLEPLAQIAPDRIDPRTGKTVRELLEELREESAGR